MKKMSILFAILSLLMASLSWASELQVNDSGYTVPEPAYVPGELLVKYKPSVRASALQRHHTEWGVSSLGSFGSIGVQHVKLPEDMTVEKALHGYRNDPDVEYAEPNYLLYGAATTPNDSFFSSLWGLHNTGQNVNGTVGTADADIDAPEAWDIARGSSSIVVAVIDSGVDYNHPDLSANVWTNAGETPANGIDDDGNGYVDDVKGWDFVDDDNSPIDSNDHGTHVTGIVGAIGNNSTGVTGVSWTVKIMILRFLNAFNVGDTADAISAIEYANSMGAHVINNSWGGGNYSQALKDVIDASSALVVCAAGNAGTDNDADPHYPSNYTSSNIIAVAATNQDDNLASFSNYGATSVDVAAPGTDILSSRPDRQTFWSDNFDNGNMNGWVTGGTENTWAVTSSLFYSGSYSLSDSPSGDYENNTNSWARTPVLNLSSHSGAKLEFKLRGVSETGYDFLYLQISTDLTTWTNQAILIGSSVFSRISGTTNDNWLDASADLGAYDGNSAVYLRFLFTSDSSVTRDGWYIDDIAVTTADTTYSGGASDYQYFQGTSMAAPFVSGLAALIKAQNPSLTNTEIKARIENSVDSKSSLNGKVVTAGRINAAQAVVAGEYTLTVNTVGQGTVEIDPPGGIYEAGTEVTLTAEPDPGWGFSGWSGDLTGSTNPATITMDSDKNITATFVEGDYTLTVNTIGQGSVTLDPPGGVYEAGTLVTLTATADRYWEFSQWSGDLTGSANPKTISMDTKKNITATFVEAPPDFDYLWEDFEGTFVSASDYGSIPSGWVAKGPDEPVVVEFSKGSEEHHGEFALHANVTYHPTEYSYIEKVFPVQPDSTLNLRVKVKGSTEGRASARLATVGQSTTKYWYRTTPGDWKTLTLEDVQAPPDGQLVVGLMVAHEEGAGSTDFDIDCLSSTVSLEGGPYDLTVSTEGQGNITLDPPGGSYAAGTVVTLTATADPGWGFSGWSGDLTGSTNPATITMDADKNVTATFVAGPFTLTVNTIGQGNVTLNPPAPGNVYDAGTEVTLNVEEVGEWRFCGWSGDLSGVDKSPSITMNSNKSVTATFIEVLSEDPGCTINNVIAVDPDTLEDEGKPDDLRYGMMEVEIGVLNPGDTGVVTFNLPDAAPTGYVWYKYTAADEWIPFGREKISGGTGDGAEFNATRDKVKLYITDNGPYDTDPTPGTVRDPSGLGSTSGGGGGAGGGGGGGGGCFIATAAYGTEMEPQVELLREFRDRFLVTNSIGKGFLDLYQIYSPPVAEFIANHKAVRAMVRWSLLPLVGVSWMALNLGPTLTLMIITLLLALVGASIIALLRRVWIPASKA